LTPVQPSQRIEVLDVLRGAALFGILASNMRAFNGPMQAYMDHSLMWTGTVDRITQSIIDLLITGKFITLFAFMFGIGFAIQMDRAAARATSSRFYLRRSAFLLAFGLLHGFLIWFGDILAPYALMSFALYLFRNRSQTTIARWALLLYLWPLVPAIAGTIAAAAGVPIPGPPRATPQEIERIIQVYSTGTYAQMFQERLKEMAFQGFGLVFFYPRVLGIFLAGLWVWRAGILSNLEDHKALLYRCQRWGLPFGLAGNAVMVAIAEIWHPDPMGTSPLTLAYNFFASIGMPAMSLFYAATLALIYLNSETWRSRLRPFGAVGRTALTNYLMQTAICTTLYNSWGFGLFGTVSPLVGLVPTFVIYAAQVAGSAWYVRRFAFGPMEWLWRTLTYGRVRQRPAVAATGST
jgi:uncharacterized protein